MLAVCAAAAHVSIYALRCVAVLATAALRVADALGPAPATTDPFRSGTDTEPNRYERAKALALPLACIGLAVAALLLLFAPSSLI